jgi:hypothetical protein
MKLVTVAPLTYDGKTYHEGDEFEVDDEAMADTIVAGGRAVRAPEAAPPAAPPKHPNHGTHKPK